jgi:hypothetical protein
VILLHKTDRVFIALSLEFVDSESVSYGKRGYIHTKGTFSYFLSGYVPSL